VTAELSDVSAATVFDVLNDPIYRKKWDFSMHEGFEICQISENSDIGYYACMYLFIMPTPIYHVNDRILEFSLNV